VPTTRAASSGRTGCQSMTDRPFLTRVMNESSRLDRGLGCPYRARPSRSSKQRNRQTTLVQLIDRDEVACERWRVQNNAQLGLALSAVDLRMKRINPTPKMRAQAPSAVRTDDE
jgi:hypothetical protein